MNPIIVYATYKCVFLEHNIYKKVLHLIQSILIKKQGLPIKYIIDNTILTPPHFKKDVNIWCSTTRVMLNQNNTFYILKTLQRKFKFLGSVLLGINYLEKMQMKIKIVIQNFQ